MFAGELHRDRDHGRVEGVELGSLMRVLAPDLFNRRLRLRTQASSSQMELVVAVHLICLLHFRLQIDQSLICLRLLSQQTLLLRLQLCQCIRLEAILLAHVLVAELHMEKDR